MKKSRFCLTLGVFLALCVAFSPRLFAQVGALDAESCRAALSAVIVDDVNSDDALRDASLALWQAAQTGTSADVPAIAPLLKMEQLNAPARIALKNIPGPEARAALRESLNILKDNNLIGVVQTLADLRDAESFDKIAAFADAADVPLATASLDALAKFGGDRAREIVFAKLAATDAEIRAAAADSALYFVERAIESGAVDAANDQLAALEAAELSAAKRSLVAKARDRAAGSVYPPSPRPVDATEFGTADEFAALLDAWSSASDAQKSELSEKARLWCRRSTPGSEYESVVAERLAETTDPTVKAFLLDLLVQVGTKKALATIVAALADSQDSTADAVTKILGGWITIDAKPYLAELLENSTVPKFSNRVLRGYLRVARQMFDRPGPKIAAINEIASFVDGADAELLKQALDEIETTRRDQSLFDAKKFAGWEGWEASEAWKTAENGDIFQIVDNEIVAGYVDKPIPRNEFLCTTKRFRDFELTLECKIEGSGANAGVQFRSERIPNHHEMIGYQADMSEDGLYWGALYDESRRGRFLAKPSDELREKIYKPGDWNEYKIVCWGRRVTIYLNGTKTVDYVEPDESIPLEGVIGLQIHQGGPSRAFYRNIRLEKL